MKGFLITLTLAASGLVIAYYSGQLPKEAVQATSRAFESSVNPGTLSKAHANLSNNCQACHTPIQGIETAKCVLCHANEESILQRQPTAFHVNINTCKECHQEHQGIDKNISSMNHSVFNRIGLQRMSKAEAGSEESFAYSALSEQLRIGIAPHSRILLAESQLDCSSCHSNEEPHQKYFGSDCAQCHAVDRWTIAEYKHPSPKSNDCSQCHAAPPSHYMMHFKMISARVAGKPHARVDQCNECHQTTSWNDIKRVGWYKHH